MILGYLKRITKLVLSVIYLALSEAREKLRPGRDQPRRARCNVLYYHPVDAKYRERFAKQMDVLVRYTRPIAADTKTPLTPGRRYSVMTFDDGFQNVVDNALPEMEKRGIPCTIFVIAGMLGKTTSWSAMASDGTGLERIMTEETLRTIPSDLVTIGAHTMTHARLTTLDPERALWEMQESRIQLEAILNRKVGLFAFPYGAFNEDLIQLGRAAGYERIFITLPGLAFSNPPEFVINRVGLEVTDWPLEFKLKVLGAYNWLPTAFSLKRKLLGKKPVFAGTEARSFVNQKAPTTSSVCDKL